MVFTECNPSYCPCKDKCTNQRIQRHQWADGLEKFTTENRGTGIRSSEKIISGTLLNLGENDYYHLPLSILC